MISTAKREIFSETTNNDVSNWKKSIIGIFPTLRDFKKSSL